MRNKTLKDSVYKLVDESLWNNIHRFIYIYSRKSICHSIYIYLDINMWNPANKNIQLGTISCCSKKTLTNIQHSL